MSMLPPVHPGEILREEFLKPLGLSANKTAERIGVPANRITSIIKGKRAVSADTAIRLARLLSTTPEFWLNLQSHYELECAKSRGAEKTARAIKPLVMTERELVPA